MTTAYDDKPDWAPVAGEGEALRRELAEARARAERAEQELAAFKDRVVEVGGRAAERHDWCDTYDEIIEELGLPARNQIWSVTVRCHYSTTIEVSARNLTDARDYVTEAGVRWNWTPPQMVEGYPPSSTFEASYEVVDD